MVNSTRLLQPRSARKDSILGKSISLFATTPRPPRYECSSGWDEQAESVLVKSFSFKWRARKRMTGEKPSTAISRCSRKLLRATSFCFTRLGLEEFYPGKYSLSFINATSIFQWKTPKLQQAIFPPNERERRRIRRRNSTCPIMSKRALLQPAL